MEKGSIYFTGRYIPDNRILKHEPSGIVETPVGNGMTALTTEPLDVVCIVPRPVQRKRSHSNLRKALVLLSCIALPVGFVACADALASSPQLFFGSFAACFGWPAVVYLANVLRD